MCLGRKLMWGCLAWLLAGTNLYAQDLPRFRAHVITNELKYGYQLIAADLNKDGKKDLIVGSFTGTPGNVRLYLNVGTDAEPKFNKPTFLEANGQPIKLPGG